MFDPPLHMKSRVPPPGIKASHLVFVYWFSFDEIGLTAQFFVGVNKAYVNFATFSFSRKNANHLWFTKNKFGAKDDSTYINFIDIA